MLSAVTAVQLFMTAATEFIVITLLNNLARGHTYTSFSGQNGR